MNDFETLMPLPCALDIERLVLGALLTYRGDQTAFGAVLGSLSAEDFWLEKHKRIFARIAAIAEAGMHVDRVTVAHALLESRELESVDGLSYLAALDEGMPEIYELGTYLGILREKALRRRLIRYSQTVIERAHLGDDDVYKLVGELSRAGEAFAASAKPEQDLRSAEEILDEAGMEILQPQREYGIKTPIPWLDGKGMHFQPKTLTTLAARPSVGKSGFALQCAVKAAQQGFRTAFYSHEDGALSMLRRMISQQGYVNMHRIRIGAASQEERDQALEAIAVLRRLGDLLQISDSARGTIPGIAQQLQRARMRGTAIAFLVVDYLQLMTAVGRFDRRVEEVSSLSRGLKLIAQQYGIPVLALSQLSRDSERENREPRLSDLRESGSIEQDSDNVIFLHRRSPIEDEVQNVRLILAKHRNGPVGRCDLQFVKRYVAFREEFKGEAA